METLTERQNSRLIPSSALAVASVLLIGIAILALLHVLGNQIPMRVPRSVRLRPGTAYSADFGRFGPQERPTLDFSLTNRSDHAIKIVEVIPSCSCIAASCSPHTVEPHASATVAVTYRGFPGALGPFAKSVAVIYQAEPTGRKKILHLSVRGETVSNVPVQVFPQTVYFGNVAPGASVACYLYLHGRLGLLRSLPAVVYLSPGHPCQLILRQVGHSRATRDISLRLILRVPVTQSAGKLSCPILFTGSTLGRVRISVDGRVLTRRPTALVGNSTHEPTRAAQSVSGEPAN